MASSTPAISSADRCFSTGERTPLSSTTIHTRPAAPRPLVSVTSWSSSFRESCAPPGAAIPWMRPPDVTTDANALNPVPANTPFRSASSIP